MRPQERDAELRKAAGTTRATPASEWAKAQLQTRAVVAERRQHGVRTTALHDDDFRGVLALPKELREDRWAELGGLYGQTPSAELHDGAADPAPVALLPSPKQLGKLRPEQLRTLWALVTAEPLAEEEKHAFRADAVKAICSLLETDGNQLSSLDLSDTGLCGLDGSGDG